MLSLAFLPLLLFVALIIYSFQSRETMTWLFANTSYYFLAALCLLWLTQLGRYLTTMKFYPRDFLGTHWPGLVLALVITSLLFATLPVHFKILGDETNLLSVSQDMHYHKSVYLVEMGKFYHGDLQVVDVSIPNRPLLFPFAINLVHAILGYDPGNVFVLNFITMFIFLSGVYVAIRKAMDSQTAVAGIFLILAYPIVTISATSGGYDLFSTTLFALSLAVFYHFLKSPHPVTFAFLWMSLLMFCNVRYESCIFFFIIIAAAARFINTGYFKKDIYVYAVTPLLSLPFIWQRFLSQGTYENPSHIPLFSVQSFISHGKIFIANLLNLNLDLPYAGFLNIIAIVIIGYCFYLFVTKKVRPVPYRTYFTFTLMFCIGTMMVIVLSHHFGRYDRPTQARLFMYISVFCALTPVLLKAIKPDWISGKKLMVAAVVIFLLHHPLADNNAFMNSLIITRIHQQTRKFLESSKDRDVFLITSYASQSVALNYSAVTIQHANQHRRDLLSEFKTHRYSTILVIQEIENTTHVPKWPNQRLDPAFKLQPLQKISISNDRYLRISRLML